MSDPTLTTSARKLAANRANAARSTGPRTDQGKARSRFNALKHGLRAEQVVLPGEDADAFEAERAAFFDEWQPPTATRAVLVDRLVADAWRLRRCVRVEGARLRKIAEEAAEAFDVEIHAEIADASRQMAVEPARSLDRLMGLRPGADLLRMEWERLIGVLGIEGEWRDPNRHHNALCRLLGLDPRLSPAELGDVAMASWALTITDQPAVADHLPWDDPDGELSRPYPKARAEKVRGLLIELAGREARLAGEQHDRLPDLEPIRQGRIDERCFDASKEAEALRRHEARLDRSFRANLNLLVRLTRTGEDLDVEAEPIAPNEPTAAPADGPSPAEVGPVAPIEPTAEPSAPNEPTSSGPDGTVPQADRDRTGRAWPLAPASERPDGPGGTRSDR